jgi:hypothetical protein
LMLIQWEAKGRNWSLGLTSFHKTAGDNQFSLQEQVLLQKTHLQMH